MIDIKTKVHDRYSVEFKMGFVAGDAPHEDDFSVGMWIFVPGSLDITPNNFTKAEFYRSVKSNIRLITPHFELGEIASGKAIPLRNVVAAAAGADYEYQLKLFCAITKSSLRDERDRICNAESREERAELASRYVRSCIDILKAFERLPEANCHDWCGEFLCNTICRNSFHMVEVKGCRDSVLGLIREVNRIRKKHGYATVDVDSPTGNRDYVHRRGVLKKYVESLLFLRVPKRRDGIIAEQAYYSLAAGLAMIFATVVAWAFQRHFGNLTWPLFIALIISYMMKDRIKELMRYWFAHRLGDRYFDNKARISFHGTRIGTLREAMDFIPGGKIPAEGMEVRDSRHLFEAENHFRDENVMLYRKSVHLDLQKISRNSSYAFEGINDIVRLQVRPFLRKMDDPQVVCNTLGRDGEIVDLMCDKVYPVNIVLQYSSVSQTEYKRFRLILDRDGIRSIEPV